VDPATDTCRVHETPGLAAQLDQLVDRVACRAGNLVDDDPILAREPVEQARLADVGSADERYTAGSAAGIGIADLRELGQDREKGIQDVTAAATVQSRDGPWLTQTEGPQHGRVGLDACVIDLVGHEDDRLAGLAQELDHCIVGVGGANGRVDDEHDSVCELYRDLGLFGDTQVDAGGVHLPAAGVDDREPGAGPLGVVGNSVPGHTWDVLDDGLASAQDAVDQG